MGGTMDSLQRAYAWCAAEAVESPFMEVVRALECVAEERHGHFVHRLVPMELRERILGVRVPLLRKLARYVGRMPWHDAYLTSVVPRYVEEELLQGFIIAQSKQLESLLMRTDALLPHLGSWYTVDSFLPPLYKEYPAELLAHIHAHWLHSEHPYTVRYALRVALAFLLKEHPEPTLQLVPCVQLEHYYVHMMQAWLLAEALALHPTLTLAFLKQQTLTPTVLCMTRQKARESRKVGEATQVALEALVQG